LLVRLAEAIDQEVGSTANLARKMGIARTTVEARLTRLEAQGLICG